MGRDSPSILDMLLDLTSAPPPRGASGRPRPSDARPGMTLETREQGAVVLLVDRSAGWVREWHRCRDWELLRWAVAPEELDLWRCGYVYGNGELCGAVHRGSPPAAAEATREYTRPPEGVPEP